MKKREYYTINKKENKEFSDLDFRLYDDVYPNWVNEDNSPWPIGTYRNDGYPISINSLIEELTLLKNNGSNYVSINVNLDHHGYDLEGLEIIKSTEDEINLFLNLSKEKNEKKKLIDELTLQLKKLKNEL